VEHGSRDENGALERRPVRRHRTVGNSEWRAGRPRVFLGTSSWATGIVWWVRTPDVSCGPLRTGAFEKIGLPGRTPRLPLRRGSLAT